MRNKNALRSSAGGQRGGRVSVATVNTLESAQFYPMPGVPGYVFRNLGAGQVWQGTITKAQLYLAWIRAEAARDPGGLWVLADGGDVGFGGCAEDDLVRRYMTVVAAGSGAQVVAGGDNFVWPPVLQPQLGNYAGLQGKRQPTLAALGLDTSSYAPYQENGVYTYVNSGFLMGPAAALLKVLECMNQHEMGWALPSWAQVEHYDDQLALTNCSFHMPEAITVDFTGSIVLETMGFRQDLLYGYGGAIYNAATRTVQCFIHGNGESISMQTLQAMLAATA